MRRYRCTRIAGFSLIELLAAAAIVGILATVAVPFVETTARRQKEHELRQALRDIRNAVDAYKQATDSGRVDMQKGESGYPPTLDVLTQGVEDAENRDGPKIYFLRRLPRDPFVADLSVPAASTWGKRSFDSPPDRPREGADVFDVYSTSSLVGLNGQPYREW
jgi:general secretion pathway protein G